MCTKRRWTGVWALALATLAGCSPARAPAPAPAPSGEGGARDFVYRCEGDHRFAVRVDPDSAVLRLDDRTLALPRVISASGARYAAGGVTYWSRGREAMLETPGASYSGCVGQEAATPWELARLLGYDFRAVGQEPGWVVEIDEGRELRFSGDYGRTQLSAASPRPGTDAAAGTTTYRVRSGEHELTVAIAARPCEDAMSGEAFAATVAVTLDGREHRGCGRALTGATGRPLPDTEWSLMSIDGVPAIASERGLPSLHLARDTARVTGFTGCNRLSGGYALDGDRLRFPEPIVTTRMACLAPGLNEQERRLLDALRATDGYTVWGDVLTLLAGERVLARFVATAAR